MRKIPFILLTFLTFGQAFGQNNTEVDYVFNSITTSETSRDDLVLIGNYYTLKNNIENRRSSVFVSDNPTLAQIEEAAINLWSDFFILTKQSKIVVMLILENNPKCEFLSVIMKDNQESSYPCKIKGEITENRAKEIIENNYDSNARIEKGKLYFNNKEFRIIQNREIEKSVWAMIKKEKLDKEQPSDMTLLSQGQLKDFILTETREGGSLDYFTEITGMESDGVQIKPGVFATKQSIALYRWGRACFDIGVNTVNDAYEIFMEFKGESVSDRFKEYIRMGYYKEWEQ